MIRAAASSSAAVSRLQRPPYNPLKATIISLAVGANAATTADAAEPRKIDGYYIEAHCVCCRRRCALAAAAYVVIVFPPDM